MGCRAGIIIWRVDPSSVVSRPSTSCVRHLARSGHCPVTSLAWHPQVPKIGCYVHNSGPFCRVALHELPLKLHAVLLIRYVYVGSRIWISPSYVPDPGKKKSRIQISIKEPKYCLTQKILDVHPRSRIRILIFSFLGFGFWIQGSKKPLIPNPNLQHWLRAVLWML